MKKLSIHIISFVLALFFLVAGSGFNVIKFCCDICSEHGIEEVTLKSCSSFHHQKSDCCESSENHENEIDTDIACSDVNHQTDGCHILRLNVETPIIVYSLSDNTRITNIQLLKSTFIFIFDFTISTDSHLFLTHAPPLFSLPTGRDILSAKSVLII